MSSSPQSLNTFISSNPVKLNGKSRIIGSLDAILLVIGWTEWIAGVHLVLDPLTCSWFEFCFQELFWNRIRPRHWLVIKLFVTFGVRVNLNTYTCTKSSQVFEMNCCKSKFSLTLLVRKQSGVSKWAWIWRQTITKSGI